MADFIDHITNTWRGKKRSLFGVSEEDELIVSRSKNGQYMVRSAYYRLFKTLQKF